MTDIETLPIVGILRGFRIDELAGIVPAVRLGGLRNLEITMNSPGAPEQIRRALDLTEGRLNIGAGTVTTLAALDEALKAGAGFIVTPAFHPSIIAECVAAKIPVFPGAFSPSEIYSAWELGARMVKIFPAETTGPAFIKAILGPFPGIKLMPTGGVDLETLPEFIQAGAAGAGVGSPLFNRERISEQDWAWLESRTRAFVACWNLLKA